MMIENIFIPPICRISIISVSSIDVLEETRDERFMKFSKTAGCLKRYTRPTRRQKAQGTFDLIFQISSLFALLFLPIPSNGSGGKYVLMLITQLSCRRIIRLAPSAWLERLSAERVVYNNAEFIFTTSENTRKSLMNYYGVAPKRIQTVGYGLSMEERDFKKIRRETTFIGMI